jgi:predicted nucleic acid-binding protein
MILIDSNIWVYAINSASPKYTVARSYLLKNASELVISHQNILETLRVLTHPKFPHPVPLERAMFHMGVLIDAVKIIFPINSTVFTAQELLEKYHLSSNQIFDAYLVATTLSWGIDTIATDNTGDFAMMQEIKVLNPFSIS